MTDEIIKERYGLSTDRIKEITKEDILPGSFGAYFKDCASFLLYGTWEDVLPDKYGTSYANPAYCAGLFGMDTGRLL